MSQLITVENQSTVLSAKDLFNLVWAINYQVLYHFGRSTWVTEEHATPAHLIQISGGVKPPGGAWNLILMDTTDQQGALGYHDDENGSGIPYTEVFCKTAIDDGATPSSVASHEILEMICDPDVQNPRTVTYEDKLWIVEVCDAVQGGDYDVGVPQGRVTGTMVSDFCLPAWFGLHGPAGPVPHAPVSFRQTVADPFTLAPQGYISTAPANDPSNWTQTFGQQQERLPAWASRLPRIHPSLKSGA